MFGMDQGTFNGTLEFISKDFGFSTLEGSYYASIMMYGCVFGALLCGWISNRLGRRRTLIISAACFSFFILIGATTHSIPVLFSSRFMLGITVGIASFSVPVYLSEIAPKKTRGGMVGFYQFMITVGILIIFISNAVLSYYDASWRLMLGIIAIPALFMFILVFLLPESPRWLMLKSREDKAREVLCKIGRSSEDTESEIEEISTSLHYQKTSAIKLLTSKFFIKVLFLGIILQVLNTLCGINPVMYYSTLIFGKAGIADAAIATIILGVINMFGTLLAVTFVDKIGKKKIVYAGLCGMAVGLLLLSVSFRFIDHESLKSYFSISMVGAAVLFIFSYAVSLGPTIWTICSEIFPLEGRDFGFAITTATNWILNALAVNFSLVVMNKYGASTLFVFFSCICIFGIFFVYFFVPETTDVSLEEIEIKLKNGEKLRNIGR